MTPAIIGGVPRVLDAWKPSGRKFAAVKPSIDVATLPVAPPIIASALGKPFPTDYDQETIGSCGPNSVGETGEHFTGQKLSRLFLYFWTRADEGTASQDSGVTIPDLLDVAQTMGMPLEELWAYDVAKFCDTPPLDTLVDATKHRVEQNDVITDLDHLLYELGTRKPCTNDQPITFGFQVPASAQSDETARTGIVAMPTSPMDIIGGHCVNAITYDRARRLVRTTHHWGPSIGDAGTLWLPFEMWSAGLVSDMRAIRRWS